MITRADIVERVAEWGLTEEVIEKDYVLGWLLWGIGTDPILSQSWVFKGGTCLKKCYIETYRFSEDLDFTVLPDGPFRPEDIEPMLLATLARITAESGIDFSTPPRVRLRPNETSTEGRVYYTGPRQTPQPAGLKLDISADEPVVRPPVLQQIGHPYPDEFPNGGTVRCYSFDELFAEKIRAMAQRSRPRDLYDIVNLFRRSDLRMYPDTIRSALEEKCAAKSIAVPTAEDFDESPRLAELESEWGNMLGHQLPALPPLEPFLEELPLLFAWLEGDVEEVEAGATYANDEDESWSPPPTVATWGTGVPLETVRFAAANHLLVELDYGGSTRLIEPYSLRRTRAGFLVLHAERADGSGHRAYRVERIQGLRVTTTPFRPRMPIEFSARGPLHAPPQYRTLVPRAPRTARSRSMRTREFLYACNRCGREFAHTTRNSSLRQHKDPYGNRCSGRSGRYIGTRH